MITKRLEYMDVLRALACFLVVLTHSALPSETGTDGIWKYLISFIASPATQVFFAISGALLIKPNIETGTFLKKRFLRLLPPVVVWSLITMVVYVLLGKKSLDEALWSVAWMPFQPGYRYLLVCLCDHRPVFPDSCFICFRGKSKQAKHRVLSVAMVHHAAVALLEYR